MSAGYLGFKKIRVKTNKTGLVVFWGCSSAGLERVTDNDEVVGSSPSSPTINWPVDSNWPIIERNYNQPPAPAVIFDQPEPGKLQLLDSVSGYPDLI